MIPVQKKDRPGRRKNPFDKGCSRLDVVQENTGKAELPGIYSGFFLLKSQISRTITSNPAEPYIM